MIETERLLLRPPRADDLDVLARYYAEPEVVRFINHGRTRTRAESEEALRDMIRRYDLDGFGMLMIERRADGAVLGRAGLNVWDTRTWRFGALAELGEDGTIELGWTLGREHWGQGYATEAARGARDWAFGELRVERLISIIHPDNAASIRVAERLGAQHEQDIAEGWVAPARIYVHPVP